MADTRHWGLHDHRAPYLTMPQLQHAYLHGHCTHQHPSCRCHGGYHDNTHGHHHHHQHHSHQPHYHSHSHHRGHHYHHGNHHHHDHTYHPRPTQVIHRHYTEHDTPGPKLLPLPPPEPKPGTSRPVASEVQSSEKHQATSTQHVGSQVVLPCPKCEGGWCSVHNTECATIFQCPECEAERDIKRHQETQAQQDCPACEDRLRIIQYDAETQARSECEVCEKQRRLIRHDAESQIATSCSECDRRRYCQTDKEVQASMDCRVCEGRRVGKRDMATQVDDMEAELKGMTEKIHKGHENTGNEEHAKGCQICSMLVERLEKSDFLEGEELLGSYVITTKMADASKKPKVKVTRKVKEPHRTSTPIQGPFDTFAEHLSGVKY